MDTGSDRAAKPQRRSDEVEEKLIKSMLSGNYPTGSMLPLERELAAELGVGRPTLREAIQRLERDGWVTVRKGQGTTVNDFWRTGSLNILPAIVSHDPGLSDDFIVYLLEIRAALAPAYVRDAVAGAPARVVATLVDWERIDDTPEAFARFDWKVQMELSSLSPNPIYFLLTRSFDGVYPSLALEYFAEPMYRAASREFYRELLEAAMIGNAPRAELLVRRVMEASIPAWRAKSRKFRGNEGGGA